MSPRINIMLDAVRRASKQLMRDFNELQISNIRSQDFINKAYLRSKQTICEILHNYKQEYGFIFENDENTSNYSWFVIPIESKENFASCVVYFSVLVCLVHKNKIVAAVVDAPALRETFWAEEKKGAFFEDARSRHIKMRVKSREGGLIDVSNNLLNKLPMKNVRSFGSIALGFTYLAAGRYNQIAYSDINQYEVLLGKLFLQESGGKLIENDGIFINQL